MKTLAFLATTLALAATVMAAPTVLEDFEGAWIGEGTLMADPADSSNTALWLTTIDGTSNAQTLVMDAPATAGKLSMRIYDFGANDEKVDSRYGPRWGVRGDVNVSCVSITYKSYISGYKGYLTNGSATSMPMTQPTSPIYSAGWFIGTAGRYVQALDDLATPAVDEAVGAWATWTFDVAADGSVAVSVESEDVVDDAGVYHSGPISETGTLEAVGALVDFFVSAGANTAALNDDHLMDVGIMVDDITWEAGSPAPLAGDANSDGYVNIQDFIILKQNYNTTTGMTWAEGDFNNDGAVNIQDFIILKQNYNTSIYD